MKGERVRLVNGPYDGKTARITWVKRPGTVPPQRLLVHVNEEITSTSDGGWRDGVYELIDNWPLRYKWVGFADEVSKDG